MTDDDTPRDHTADWADQLAAPVAFVLSGGAGLGAIQVGMLQSLAAAGLAPDLLVGTSVGSLNGTVVAEAGSPGEAAERLEALWLALRRRDVFPGGVLAQASSLIRTGHLHPARGLRRVITDTLRARRFEQLALPLVVVAAETLTGHVAWLEEGELVPALLAASALPGVFPPVELGGRLHWDGGSVANVPLGAAVERGAGSLVVLDAGDVCHLDEPPRGVPDAILHAAMTAMRQRVLVEAPLVAEQVPLAYLPRPCVHNRSLLDLDHSGELIDPARALVDEFLRDNAPPTEPGAMVGAPHDHGPAVRPGALP